jgi:DNA-binding LacI/PurR family transcriptional regulator
MDVAEAAGVSLGAAVKALIGDSGVDTKARRAVQRAAQALEFRDVDWAAASPDGRKTGCIGVVVSEPINKMLAGWFFAPFLTGVYEALSIRSTVMSLFTPDTNRDSSLNEVHLLSGAVDGVILASLHQDDQLPHHLSQAGLPIVICGHPPKGIRAGWVDCDNRAAARMAMEHLISLGRKKIAVISGLLDLPSATDRLAGYRDGLEAAGLPLDVTLEEVADFDPERARMATERLLLNHPDLDAVFAGTDDMAVAAISVLLQARRRVPEDVAVIGFDDSPVARVSRPSLSSVRQPIAELGHQSVALLFDQIADPEGEPRHTIVQAEIAIRESTAGRRIEPRVEPLHGSFGPW